MNSGRTRIDIETSANATINAGTTATRVLIVDDHAMVAEALGASLAASGDIVVAGIALTNASGLALAGQTAPDVIVLDSHLPDSDIVELIRAFHDTVPQARIIVLGAGADYKVVMRALEAGASGFLLKGQRVSELVDAVHTVHAGSRALAAELVSAIVDRLSAPATRRFALTDREIEVLARLADGATTVAVSRDLRLSVNTVRNHIQSAIRRLGAHSKLEAISIARREGLIGEQSDQWVS